MVWIEVKNSVPLLPGKYVVKTKTTMGNTHIFETTFNGKTFSVSNQTVTYWLKEN